MGLVLCLDWFRSEMVMDTKHKEKKLDTFYEAIQISCICYRFFLWIVDVGSKNKEKVKL
jgi:hypothetical protein